MSTCVPTRIFCFDDQPFALDRLKMVIAMIEGWQDVEVLSNTNGEDANREVLLSKQLDLAIVDWHGADGETCGRDLLKKIRVKHPHSTIIVLTQDDSSQVIVEALQAGADDLVRKDCSDAALRQRIVHAYLVASRRRSIHSTSSKNLSSIVSGSTLQAVAARVPQLIQSAVRTIHIHGESGTGKELVAQLFGDELGAQIPFVKVNCATIPEALIEAELFGAERGSYTGAVKSRTGVLEEADGGWVFLDELDSLSLTAQAAILRFIESGEIKRIGGNQVKSVQVRIISASNAVLADLVERGRFRLDLWQRLTDVCIELPPLRMRREEIPAIIRHIVVNGLGEQSYSISEEAVDLLSSLDWAKGNVRELRACLRAMTEFAEGFQLTPQCVPASYFASRTVAGRAVEVKEVSAAIAVDWNVESGGNVLKSQRALLAQVLRRTHEVHGPLSLRSFAQLTGIAKSSVRDRLEELVMDGHVSARELKHMIGIDLH
jgi:DNA-binding NtrC family response regulator